MNAESVSRLKRHSSYIKPTAECTTIKLLREVLPAACRKEGKEIEGALFIIDLQDFGYVTASAVLIFSAAHLIIFNFVDLANSGI